MSAEATVLDGPAAPPPRGLPVWVLVSGIAATGALVGAPLAATRGALSPLALVLAAVAPVLLIVGAWRSAPAVLLGCVPVAWALPGLTTAAPASVWTPAMVGTALLCAASYVVATGLWARRMTPSTGATWTQVGQQRGQRSAWDPLAIVAVILVAGPAVGVVLWPGVLERLMISYPHSWARMAVVLVLVGTVVGLAMATDLARGRAPLTPSLKRGIVLSLLATAMAALWFVISGGH